MKAHEKLSDESKWIKGWFAEKEDGSWTLPDRSDAARFCMIGAVNACYPNESERELVCRRIDARIGALTTYAASEWNDDEARTFDDVRNLLLQLDI